VQFLVAPGTGYGLETQKTCNYAVDGLNLKIRVWSTLNYPFTFAYFMMAGLLLLLSSKEAFG